MKNSSNSIYIRKYVKQKIEKTSPDRVPECGPILVKDKI